MSMVSRAALRLSSADAGAGLRFESSAAGMTDNVLIFGHFPGQGMCYADSSC